MADRPPRVPPTLTRPPAEAPRPRTTRTVVFQGCHCAILPPSSEGEAWQLQIVDPLEATTYVFPFGDELRQNMIKVLSGGVEIVGGLGALPRL
jgi:hypothetical protein